jgi:hypothetical protein
MNRLASPTAAAVCIALAFAGCGSSGNSSKPSTTRAARASATTGPLAPLLGTYTRFMSKADIARTQTIRDEAGPNQQTPTAGAITMTIAPAVITSLSPGIPPIRLDYSATSTGKLEIKGYRHPEIGSFCGPDIAQNASYTWKRTGHKLTLRATSDRCADRDSTMTGVWTAK